jgi:hypothetical protein
MAKTERRVVELGLVDVDGKLVSRYQFLVPYKPFVTNWHKIRLVGYLLDWLEEKNLLGLYDLVKKDYESRLDRFKQAVFAHLRLMRDADPLYFHCGEKGFLQSTQEQRAQLLISIFRNVPVRVKVGVGSALRTPHVDSDYYVDF